jgi:hypothetical protein
VTDTNAGDAVDAAAVRSALRHLAEGTAPGRPPDDDAVVADAEDAIARACDAADFVATGRLPALARAVGTATVAGDDATVRRGRRALDVLRRFDRAARGEASDRRGSTALPDRPTTVRASDRSSANHIHRGRGTVLPRAGQSDDR